MKNFNIIKAIIKHFILPLIAIFIIVKFNLFSYIRFIPEDYRFEGGLAVYLGIIGSIYESIENALEKKKAKITCTFYVYDKEINNIPTIVCDDNSNGTAFLNCHIELEGNLKKLRNSSILLSLPEWLTSQVSSNDIVLNYNNNNQLLWTFDKLLPERGNQNQKAEYNQKIPFIINRADSSLSILLKPQIEQTKRYIGVSFESNGFKVENGG